MSRDNAAALSRLDGPSGWDEDRWNRALERYWAEHDWIGIDQRARSASLCRIVEAPERTEMLAVGVPEAVVEAVEDAAEGGTGDGAGMGAGGGADAAVGTGTGADSDAGPADGAESGTGTDADSRDSAGTIGKSTGMTPGPGAFWLVEQTLLDPADNLDWRLVALVDVAESDHTGSVVLRMIDFSPR